MLNPILASSALRRMRSARAIVIVGVYQAVLLAFVCLGMSPFLFGSTVTVDRMGSGVSVCTLLLTVQFALIVFVAPAMTASSIAGERERQTLELLLVTNTGSLSIALGKLMESFAFLALLIASGLPAMCLTMALGGVTLAQVLTGMLFLLVCAFAAASVGVLCSSFMKNTVTATIVSYVLLLAIGVVTLLPLALGVDRESITGVLYDDAAYAAMSPMDGVRLLPKLLFANPFLGLLSVIEEFTGVVEAMYVYGQGRPYAVLLMIKKIGLGAFTMINMAVMVLGGLLLLLIASRLIRPRRVRVRRRS